MASSSSRREIAAAWRAHRPYLRLAVALFVLGCLLGGALVGRVDLFGLLGLDGLGEALPEEISVLTILLNNTGVFLFALLGTLSFGLLTAIVLVFNGIVLGYVAVPAARESGVDFVIVAIVPHALFELTAFFIAAAVAFRLIHRFIERVRDRRDRVLESGEGRRIGKLLLLAWVLLALAAVIEVHVTIRLVEHLVATLGGVA